MRGLMRALALWALIAAPVAAAGIDSRRIEVATPFASGSTVLRDVRSGGAVSALTVRVYGLAPATVSAQLIGQDSQPGAVFDNLADGVATITVTVSAPLKRLVTEVVTTGALDLDLYLARDANGDGVPQAAELVNSSATAERLESIDQTDPPGGTYFVLIHNYAGSGAPDLVEVALGRVPLASAGNLAVVGPSMAAAGAPFDLNVAWDLPGAQAGERWYGAFDVGADAAHPGDIGYYPVDIRLVPVVRRYLPLVRRGS